MSPEQIALFMRIITVPNGIIYVTGPTGSGKTTLQYALLATQDLSDVVVITLEDPLSIKFTNTRSARLTRRSGARFR
ncbi:ATPase, T2SS/T4P/T4SS family (plasmid) [Termitidicoccus mucosus]|uniref:ATPase, T2SS/T4P/T4SS family n=1 Tax=Termitidicoccus mucosus TaxID=1184151 RepID=UPI0031842FA8